MERNVIKTEWPSLSNWGLTQWCSQKGISTEFIYDGRTEYYVKYPKDKKVPKNLDELQIRTWKRDDDYNYYIYQDPNLERHLEGIFPAVLIITDNNNEKLLHYFKFKNYIYPPTYQIEEPYTKKSSRIDIDDVKISNDTLFFSHTSAPPSSKDIGYISAVNIRTGEVYWTTKSHSCNTNFKIYGPYIIAGWYGLVNNWEYSYLSVIDKATGSMLNTIPLEGGVKMMETEDNLIYCRSYDHEYAFEIREE